MNLNYENFTFFFYVVGALIVKIEKFNSILQILDYKRPSMGVKYKGQYQSDFHNMSFSSVFKKKSNKTSIQWTPGSRVYLNIKKNNFGQK